MTGRELSSSPSAGRIDLRSERPPLTPAQAWTTVLRDAITTGDLGAATDALRLNWFDLLRDDTRDYALTVLEAVPPRQLASHPLLAMALGLRYNADPHRRSKAPYYFGLASLGIRNPAHRISPPERALILAGESAALRLMGRHALSVKSARAAVRVLESIREDREAVIGYLPRVYAQIGTSLYYGGQEAEALRVYARGYAESPIRSSEGFANLSMTAGIHALAGNLAEASEYADIARGEPFTDEQRRTYSGTFYRLAEAVLALERFDAEGARAHLAAMQHDRRTIEHWRAIARVEAMTALVAGQPAEGLAGLEALAVLRGAEGQSPLSRRRLSSVRSLLHVALGNYEAAAAVLRDDAGRSAQDTVDRARLSLVLDRTSEALRALRTIAGRPQSLRTRAEALAIEAAIGLRTGRGGRSEAVVQQLISLLRRSGQRIAPLLIPECDWQALRAEMERLGGTGILGARQGGSFLLARPLPPLTPRELAVLEALARTASVSDIAAELFVSVNTVKSQLRSIYRKLGAGNREEALTVALFHHLIAPAETVEFAEAVPVGEPSGRPTTRWRSARRRTQARSPASRTPPDARTSSRSRPAPEPAQRCGSGTSSQPSWGRSHDSRNTYCDGSRRSRLDQSMAGRRSSSGRYPSR